MKQGVHVHVKKHKQLISYKLCNCYRDRIEFCISRGSSHFRVKPKDNEIGICYFSTGCIIWSKGLLARNQDNILEWDNMAAMTVVSVS
jgi:hypothetical protein